MHLSDIVDTHHARQDSWAFHHIMVVEYLHHDVGTQDAVVAVGNGIHYQFCPTEWGILRYGYKPGIFTQKGVLLDLRINKSDCLLCHLQDTTLERYILHHIHLAAKTLFITQIAYYTDTCPLEELLRVFAKQQYGCTRHFVHSVYCRNIPFVGT